MHDIFLSYAKEDKGHAQRIARALENEGFDVWWDVEIPTGTKWRNYIVEAISKSKCVVVLWSKRSVDSDWVNDEAAEGKKNNKLIPVRIEDVEIPMGFRGTQSADLINWNKKRDHKVFERLIGDIKLIVTDSSLPPLDIEEGNEDDKEPIGDENSEKFIFGFELTWIAVVISILVMFVLCLILGFITNEYILSDSMGFYLGDYIGLGLPIIYTIYIFYKKLKV